MIIGNKNVQGPSVGQEPPAPTTGDARHVRTRVYRQQFQMKDASGGTATTEITLHYHRHDWRHLSVAIIYTIRKQGLVAQALAGSPPMIQQWILASCELSE